MHTIRGIEEVAMKRLAAALVVFFFVIAGCSTAHKAPRSMTVAAQAKGAVIEGIVVLDGNPLPGATITLSDPNHRTFSLVSDVHGRYRFVAVTPGEHTIRVELPGLTTRTNRILATTKEATSVWTQMKLAEVAETITVTAMATPGRKFVVDGLDAHADAPQYAPLHEHDIVDATKEKTTTFAIDVDRASYANVRRFLTRGLTPPPEAVRIEELINYFSYRLPQPAGAEPFSITTEVAGCPWNEKTRLLRIAIQGRNLEEWQAAPNNLVFLLDVSGSMAPAERLPLIKSAMRVLVDRLRAEDKVSIVVYAGAAGLVLPPTSGADKKTIIAALDALQSGGSTAGGQGIELAYQIARDNFIADGNNRVILATDGDFNVGISDLDSLQKLIEEKRKSGVYLTTIGVGDDNYRDSVLELLADKGNGNYAYLDTLKEAEKVFKHELTGTLVTIAKDVKVQLEFDPALVESYRQIGYENRALANKDFEDDTKDAGDLGAGHTVTALYEFTPRRNTTGARIATVRLRYKFPKGETSLPIESIAQDGGKSAYDASPDLQFAAAVAEFGMLLRHSPHRGNATFKDVLQLARISRGEDLDGLRDEFIRLADSARTILGEAPPAIAGQ